MTTLKGPINLTKTTRDRFNRFKGLNDVLNEVKMTQDEFINYLLDLYKEKFPKIKNIIKSE